ncbi:hypothetical protein [Sporomusa sp.]|jgi:hypothetical protein|uniref:hypothetical protein n=1 Tax=Sporomusa sp. TaxID=2078658 RepID=UPI002975992E|nr:hypothetical protein [Sporomusa sp.]MDF2570743.1 hypothetical protein [Sporomusa sp.]MDF2876368.1 hypothetical protein [Sporomusa sp.]
MMAVDIVGLIISIIVIGIRYPHFALAAALANTAGQVLMAIFLAGNIEKIVTAGAFSSASVTNLSELKSLLFAFSGPLTNFIISKAAGGIEFVSTAHLVNPAAVVKHPFAVTNLRFAVISLILSICQFF